MDPTFYYIIAQVLGIIGMSINIISYQFKKSESIMVCHLAGSVFFTANYFMLGSVMGGIMNIISAARALYYGKTKKPSPWAAAAFIFISAVFYVLNFAVFGKEPTVFNFAAELLTVVGFAALTVGFHSKNSNTIRKCGFINSPAWLTYNIITMTVGGIVCEAFSIVSITVATLRLRKAK